MSKRVFTVPSAQKGIKAVSDFMFLVVAFLAIAPIICIFRSFRLIGPTEVGLVTKRLGRRLPEDNLIALRGEAGY